MSTPNAASPSQIHTVQNGRVLVATLNNPPHALMTTQMVNELRALVERAERDPGIGAVILTGGHPQRFLAHFDVAELWRLGKKAPQMSMNAALRIIKVVHFLRRLPGMERLLTKTPAAGVLLGLSMHDVFLNMGRSGVVYIAAINGAAMGGGCELALACDYRLITDQSEFESGIGQPEVLLGFPPGAGGTQRLARLIGRAQALEMCLSGMPLFSDEALAKGVVHAVVPAKNLMSEALTLAQRMANRPKRAVAAIKRAMLEGGSLPLTDGLQVEQAAFLSTLASPGSRRAQRAYLDRFKAINEVPAYDPESREKLLNGTFVDLTTP
jgi:enoyl-CoA hydratase/carnithine racemase